MVVATNQKERTSMRILYLPKQVYYIARHRPVRVSADADQRVQKLRLWKTLKEKGLGDREVESLLRVSRATLYRWSRRLEEKGPRGLEKMSRRPHRIRKPCWSVETTEAVLRLRQEYPGWGRDKLAVLLKREGMALSSSTVGRILVSLKRRGVLHEAPLGLVKLKKRHIRRPYAVRKPKNYPVSRPGDLVQVDTLDVRPLDHAPVKHFTARDVISRWDVLEAHERATARTATQFLDTVLARMPFPVKAIQVDGGSEFRADFEQACQARGLRLFILPPHSPKLNGRVERAHRTHLEEFYAIIPESPQLEKLNIALYKWERVYNHIRPHQALDYLTPAEYIDKYHPDLTSPSSHMY
jgi:transposase InsO family protein